MADFHSMLEKIATNNLTGEESINEPVETNMSPEQAQAVADENSLNAAELQQPLPPEDTAALEAAMADAAQDLDVAKETVANLQEQFDGLEKQASDNLFTMGALATLLELSSNEETEESIQKIAQERLKAAFESEESFDEVIVKTANEVFSTDEAVEDLHKEETGEWIVERLASFMEDDEMEKTALEVGGVLRKTREFVGDYVNSVKNIKTLKTELEIANQAVDEASQRMVATESALRNAQVSGNVDEASRLSNEVLDVTTDRMSAIQNQMDAQEPVTKAHQALGVGGGLLAAGALGGGKKIYDMTHQEPESELSEKIASDTIATEENGNYEGGYNMSENKVLVESMLKLAGAAALVEIANGQDQEMAKVAFDRFEAITNMKPSEMGPELIKVATEVYNEDTLKEIVSGHHTDEIFEKTAGIVSWNDMSAPELEELTKTAANASGVAAKSVGGELANAKAQVEEKVKKEKEKSESKALGREGTKKADDMTGYNVVNNPGEYKVDKTASDRLLEDAYMQKEAALQNYIAADNFINNNIHLYKQK